MEPLASSRRHCVRVTRQGFLRLVALLLACSYWGGCGDGIQQPSTERLTEFAHAGPDGPVVDLDRVAKARLRSGPYRVVPGDVLQVEMPQVLDPRALESTAATGGKETYTCRIGDAGAIILPVVGPLPVAGKSLAEIESSIIASYCPKFVKAKPPVYVSVFEHKTQRVSVVGAVARSGIYALRHDQMTLVGLLMEAGGIVDEGAALIKINRFGQAGVKRLGLSHMPASRGLAEKVISRRMFADWTVPARSEMGIGPAGAGVRPHMLFVREGPLHTTGWLLLARGNEVAIRKWLDLGREHQRRQFLHMATARARCVTGSELERRLSRLALFLESWPPGQEVSLSVRDPVWNMTRDGHFATVFVEPVGGISRASPAAMVQSTESQRDNMESTATLVLPVRGLSIPFADVVLQEGDSIVVEPPPQQFVSVVGLVGRPGNFPYPHDVRYTLIQAIALAGGLDLTADPRYVSVYRLKADGTIADVTLQLVDPENQEKLTETLAMPLKPGDVVSVEHTLRTRTNRFLDRVFRVSLGLYFRPESLWDDD